jgi:hypothetical protein
MKQRLIQYLHFLVVIPVIALHFVVCIPAMRRVATRWQCNSTLGCIDMALSAYCYPPRDTYPSSLSLLSSNDVSPLCFVCPFTDTEPQWNHNLDEWSDRMYLAGLGPGSPRGIPVVVCPPVNHGNRGGNVLFTDHTRRWIPSPEIDRVIERMYAYSQSNGLRVVVSEALMKRSKGRYKSRP